MSTAPRSEFTLASIDAASAAVRQRALLRRAALWAALLLAFVALALIDQRLLLAVAPDTADARERIANKDWNRLLRVAGYVPTWLLVAFCLWLHDAWSTRRGHRPALPEDPRPLSVPDRAVLLVLGVAAAGLVAELGKVLVQRHRPVLDDAAPAWVLQWAQSAPYDASFAMPSSHAAVAFGAAFALGRLFPAVRWPVLALAIGCGLTRMLAGRHFATDILVAGVLAYLGVALVWRVAARVR